jgi:hypothetical protein
MAAPPVLSRSTGASAASDSTSYTPDLSGLTITTGKSVLIIVSSDGNPDLTTSSTDWLRLGITVPDATNAVSGVAFVKLKATGSDALVVNSSQSQQYTHASFCIDAGDNPSFWIAAATGSSTNTNPPNNDTLLSRDILWIATRSGDAQVVATGAPTNFTNLQSQAAAGANGASTNTAERTLTAQSLDPGTFTSATEQWVSFTIAVWAGDPPLTEFAAARDHPTNNALALQVGHSHMTGYGAVNAGSMSGDAIKLSYPQLLADEFTACLARSADAAFMGDQNCVVAGTALGSYNTNINLGANWAVYAAGATLGAKPLIANAAGTVTFTPDVAFDRLQVFFARYSGSPQCTVNVDGGSSLGTLAMNGSDLYTSATYSVSDATHQIRVVAPAAGSLIAGVLTWRSSVKQLTFFNMAWAGGLVTDYLSSATAFSPVPALRTFGNVGLTQIHLDANEIINGIAVGTFSNNLAAFVLERRAYGSVQLISSVYMNPASVGVSEANQRVYHNEVAKWAALLNCDYVRGTDSANCSSFSAANAAGLMDPDGIHPTATGGDVAYKTPILAKLDASASPQSLTAPLLTNSSTVYAPTVSQPQVLSPALVTNASTLYTPTVTPGQVTLSPGLLTNASSFYSPTVTPGAVSLSPGLLTNTSTLYAPTVSQAAVTLSPPLLTNTSVIYAATVTPGPVSLSPGLLTNASTIYSPTVTQGGGAQNLTASLLTNSNTLYAPTVTPGAVTLSPGRLDNVSDIYPPTVLQAGLQTLQPSLFANSSVIFLPAVANDNPGGVYPLSFQGGGTVVVEMVDGQATVVGGTITFTGGVIAGALRGRS